MNALPPTHLILVLLVCTGASCSTGGQAAKGPTTMITGDDTTEPPFAPDAKAEQGADTSGCGVRQAARTFVGFSDEQSLDDFDLTAREAERVLAAAKVELCRLGPSRDKDGTLRAALSGGIVEITAVRFRRGDLTSAVLNLQTAPADDGEPSALEIRWIAQAKRVANAWEVVSAVREQTKRAGPPKPRALPGGVKR
jgi:hypothetical protein